MSQTYFALLTAIGEAKLANAAALGTPLQISRMAVGDGNGNLPVPIRTQTALVHETYRADLNELKVDPANASQIIAELVIPETEGGYWLREMGLYDAAGDLIAVSNCPPSYKPQLVEGSGRVQIMRMVLIVASTAAVQLKIDPSIVLATRAYADAIMVAHLAALDPHPQYTTESEVQALINTSINGQDGKQSARYTTTANINLNGLSVQAGGDWPAVLPAGTRVLVKDQAAGANNGLYVAAAGGWARAADADATIEVTPGLWVHVEEGAANADSVWQLITNAPIDLGVTALVFEQIAGPTGVVAGTYDLITVNKQGRAVGGVNKPEGLQVFSAVGAHTFTVPANALPSTVFEVEVWGAGGGGGGGANNGNSGGGGGGGGYSYKRLTGLAPGSTVAVTVGAAGTAGPWGYPGGPGGSSSFGAHCSATGGGPGQCVNLASPGITGGTGTGGDLNFAGDCGDPSEYTVGGSGGMAARGGGGGLAGYAAVGGNGFAPGGGGGGGDGPSFAGGAGAAGMVVVKWR